MRIGMMMQKVEIPITVTVMMTCLINIKISVCLLNKKRYGDG